MTSRNTSPRAKTVPSLSALALLITGGMLYAGPLNPPEGPIAPTAKPLAEVEPRIAINATNTPGDADSLFRITQPGSYYLTGNVTGVVGKHGIEIAASYVTLDLNGFAMTGVPGSLSGIVRTLPGTNDAIVVKNGTVASWGNDGLSMGFSSPTTNLGARLEAMTATRNALDGFVLPDGSSVVECVSTRNGEDGFESGNNATFIGCIAQGNASDGFATGFGMVFDSCDARGNAGRGFVANTSKLDNCSATNNTIDGFNVDRSSLTACSSVFNSGYGYRLVGSQALHCISSNNAAGGFIGTSNNTIGNCSVVLGLVGMEITGEDNRIDGNSVTDCTTGIRVTGTGNFIVRNSVSGGTRYSIGANNRAGPIVLPAGMAALTNPMANFEF